MDYEEHSAPCGSRTDLCDKCNERVMLRYMEEHHALYCGKPRPQPTYHRQVKTQVPLPYYSERYPQPDSYGRPVLQPAISKRTPSPSSPVPLHDSPTLQNGFHPTEQEEGYGLPSAEVGSVQPGGNVTMMIDQDWVGSVANACGEDNLDSMIAQNMGYEDARRMARRDRGMLVKERGG